MKYFSTFTGAGGFEIALNKLEMECVGFSEFNPQCPRSKCKGTNTAYHSQGYGFCFDCNKKYILYADLVLKYKYPNIHNYGDITTIRESLLPDFDLLVGGSPCQDFSVAGKQKGLSGRRSGLFYNYIQILEEKKPAYFIWENVKGVMSSDQGWGFAEIQIAFTQAGYDICWQILNARDFGIPQNRERLFVVGCLRGKGRPEVLRVFKNLRSHTKQKQGEAVNCIDANYYKGVDNHGQRTMIEITAGVSDAERIYDSAGVAKTLKALGGGLGAKTGLYMVSRSRGKKPETIQEECSPTITTSDFPNNNLIVQRQPLKFLGRNQKNFEGDYAYAVDTLNTGGVRIGSTVRRLTPQECEKLMSWDVDHTKYGVINIDGENKIVEISDDQRYRMCGNGVVSEVVYQLAKPLTL